MSSTYAAQSKLLPEWLQKSLQEWWPILLGLLVLYVPTYYSLSTGLWNSEDQAHGPIVLMVTLFLIWQNREHLALSKSPNTPSPLKGEGWGEGELLQSSDEMSNKGERKTSPILGAILLVIGLLSYILGRSQDIILLEIGSQIPVLMGVLLITRGLPTLKAMWFPLFFILFMIPLPGVFIDAVTLPMKMAVSYVAEHILFWLNYPIARSGVILQIGQYQLLVANACAGMHTLISLEALGLLYLNLVKHDSLFRNISLAILIIPISFTANVIRVIVLTLITYYFGDAAGQGFVHGFAGMLLFVVALVLIMSVDTLLSYADKRLRLSA
jgi:exosortase B